MSYINDFLNSPFNIFQMQKVLEEVNNLFDPSLFCRIKKDLGFLGYINKVLENGSILIIHNDSEIEGFVTFYKNDIINKKAFISVLAVREKYQGKGVADALIRETIRRIKNSEMISIILNTWINNKAAVNLYKKHGFLIKNITNTNITLELKLK